MNDKNVSISHFQVKDNCLVVNNVPLTRLVQRVGGTPFYAYDRSLIDSRLEELKKVFDGVSIHYAIKANPMPELVSHLSSKVDGFDVASTREMQLALNSGMNPSKISLAGPVKTFDDILKAVAAGVVINVESFQQLEDCRRASEELGYQANVAIRINPPKSNAKSGMRMGGGHSVFGIDSENAGDAILKVIEYGLNFTGLHIFNGSQDLNEDSIMESQASCFALASELYRDTGVQIPKLNIGGGLGIPYFSGQKRINITNIANNLAKLIEDYHQSTPESHIVMELGRYLVGEAGIYVCKVIDKKASRGVTYLSCDGGMHHHLAASGNFGQVFRKDYPIAIGNKMESKSDEDPVVITGPLCTPLDKIGSSVNASHALPGDLVVVFQSGAYGLTASPTAFLSQPAAMEVLV